MPSTLLSTLDPPGRSARARLLGELLVDRGIVSAADIQKALAFQEQFGGREAVWETSEAARELAASALAAAPAPPVYARVDMVGDATGKLHIMELELIEPSLFLHHAPDKGAAFGSAVYAAI